MASKEKDLDKRNPYLSLIEQCAFSPFKLESCRIEGSEEYCAIRFDRHIDLNKQLCYWFGYDTLIFKLCYRNQEFYCIACHTPSAQIIDATHPDNPICDNSSSHARFTEWISSYFKSDAAIKKALESGTLRFRQENLFALKSTAGPVWLFEAKDVAGALYESLVNIDRIYEKHKEMTEELENWYCDDDEEDYE